MQSTGCRKSETESRNAEERSESVRGDLAQKHLVNERGK